MKICSIKDEQAVREILRARETGSFQAQEEAVRDILNAVKEKGDEAVFSYTEQFDGIRLNEKTVRVSEEEINRACERIDAKLAETIRRSAANIRDFHARQRQQSWFMTREDGTMLGQKITPLQSVGIYVPGGRAAYPSSVLMNAIPAREAGVENVYMATPAASDGEVHPGVLFAAREAGVDAIFKVGGAQAIAAFATGTRSIPRVDKITGPGNIYVALAKKAVFGTVGIDSVAGPSEILILADDSADPRFVAADLLSQAEHDELAQSILITTSEDLAKQVNTEIELLLTKLERNEIIEKSLTNCGCILLAETLAEAVRMANEIAPEHLEILTRDPLHVMTKIRNAGAIFLGSFASEPLGDYFAGPNHILPTNGTARFFSPLSVDDFVKKSSVIYCSQEALESAEADIRRFAASEGLDAHANSIAVRFES